MTADVRQLIRVRRDLRRRQLLADEAHDKSCGGCGADYDSRTIGCRVCTDRHRNRIRPDRRRLCAQCGCRYPERTTGCHTCTERHRYRRKRAKVAA